MSEEIASADSLLIINADLSRQIGELNTTIGYQDAMLAVLRQVLVQAQADVCSLHCPSTWRTADGPPPHSARCQAISAALDQGDVGAQLLAKMAELIQANTEVAHLNADYLIALSAAYDALMSYAYGNSAPGLAKEVAAHVLATIEKASDHA